MTARSTKKILIIFGTRPEAIKLAPLIKEFANHPDFSVSVCLTGQHREMLDQVINFFELHHHHDLDLMKKNQSLTEITSGVLLNLKGVFEKENPDLVLLQGDTTTTLASALAAFYHKIPIAHLEAGLRNRSKYSPFPEEVNRLLASHLADYHFAPTRKAVDNLKQEGLKENVFLVGNTVVDALLWGVRILKNKGDDQYKFFFKKINLEKKIILVTCHRRENFGSPIQQICKALGQIAREKDVEIVIPVHLNPKVREPIQANLKNLANVHLYDPLPYPHFIWLMEKSYLILTDSGGIQEEAPSLGKPVLVMRDTSERPEGIEAGTASLVGTDSSNIVAETRRLLDNIDEYQSMSKSVNPYGDGTTSIQVVAALNKILYLHKD